MSSPNTEIDLTLPSRSLETAEEIRPEVQALIDRGQVEISEVSSLNCNRTESDALIDALTNDSFARRLERTQANIKIPAPPVTEHEQNLWDLFNAVTSARRRLEHDEIKHSPEYDAKLVASLESALAKFPPPTRPGITYVGALHVMAVSAVNRLKN